MQSVDNNDMVMSIVRRWGGVPMTHYMANIEDYPEPGSWNDFDPDEWNGYAISPYLPILDEQYIYNGIVTRFVGCPSASADFIQEWNRLATWPNFDFIEIGYCYWGRADGLDVDNRSPNALEVLTLNELSSERLIMSEILLLTGDSLTGGYRYNHGINGWSWNGYAVGGGGHDVSPNPKATGRNQLFGDGHVRWKVIPADNNLPTYEDPFFQQNNGMWNGADSGWVGDPWDIAYF
jgi:prepilin-type processing-associated H-X9-DG protein